MTHKTILAAVEGVLVAHQAGLNASCFCGWNELGRSHAGHQAAMLDKAAVLATDPTAAAEALAEALR